VIEVGLPADLSVTDDVHAGRLLVGDRRQGRGFDRLLEEFGRDPPDPVGADPGHAVVDEALMIDQSSRLGIAAHDRRRQQQIHITTLGAPMSQKSHCRDYAAAGE
jgi:hypothetical protein